MKTMPFRAWGTSEIYVVCRNGSCTRNSLPYMRFWLWNISNSYPTLFRQQHQQLNKCQILWYSLDHCLWRTFSRSDRSGNHLLMCSISLFSGQFITTTRKVTTRRPTTGYYPFILSFLYSITIPHRDRPEALFPFKFHPVRRLQLREG